MHIVVDTGTCQAYANCLLAAPDLFDLDDETNVAVVLRQPADAERAAAEEAVRSCPVQALTLHD